MTINPLSKRTVSLIGGITLLIMTVFSIFAFGIVLGSIYVEGAPAETLHNIQTQFPLYMAGNISWILILIMDVIVAGCFYLYLRDTHKPLAAASGLLRLIYTFVFAIGIAHLFINNISTYMQYWSIGLIIIGLHLIVTGIATFYDADIPKIIGILLIIAGSAYSLIHGIYNFAPMYEDLGHSIETVMAVPMTLGELSFGIWLLAKGGRQSLRLSPQ